MLVYAYWSLTSLQRISRGSFQIYVEESGQEHTALSHSNCRIDLVFYGATEEDCAASLISKVDAKDKT